MVVIISHSWVKDIFITEKVEYIKLVVLRVMSIIQQQQ